MRDLASRAPGGVVLESITKNFGAHTVIHGASVAIEDGEFVVVVGPSGCGKSTLLRLIAGLDVVTSGNIFIAGRNVTALEPSRRDLAMVFQSYALYPHLDVQRNMGFSLSVAHRPKAEIRQRVAEVATMLRLTDLLARKPSELSGGQRQRVAIGRALVRNPRVFLFDEPLSNLDAELRVDLRRDLAKLHQEIGATMIYVTHDQVEAMTLADRIVVMNGGRVQQVGAPLDLYQQPANRFVAGFIGSPRMNFLDLRVVSVSGREMRLERPGLSDGVTVQISQQPPAPGTVVTVGLRPEHVQTDDGPGLAVEATSTMVEAMGNVLYEYFEGPEDLRLTVERRDLRAAGVGTTARLILPTQRLHLFAPSGERINTG